MPNLEKAMFYDLYFLNYVMGLEWCVRAPGAIVKMNRVPERGAYGTWSLLLS